MSVIDLPPEIFIESFFPKSGFFILTLFILSNKLVTTLDFFPSLETF